MIPHVKRRAWMVCAMALIVLLFSSITIPLARDDDDDGGNSGAVLDLVYVSSNIATRDSGNTSGITAPKRNSVYAFRRDAAGSLTEIARSPFRTGGTGIFDVVGASGATLASELPAGSRPFDLRPLGVGFIDLGILDNDQPMILNRARNRLFVVNAGSNSISVFDIRSGGRLRPVSGSPFPSRGVLPTSLGLAGENEEFLVVVNKDDRPGGPFPFPGEQGNITTFRVNPSGRLTPVPDSTILIPRVVGRTGEGLPFDGNPTTVTPVPDSSSSPAQALISPDGSLVFVVDFLGGFLRPFRVEGNGRLSPSQPFDLRRLPPGTLESFPFLPFPLGAQVHPTQPILYVGFVFDDEIGVFSYDSQGNLTFERSVENSGLAVCWFVINRDATRMYTTNQLSNDVSVYSLADPRNPVEIQREPLATAPPGSPENCGEPSQLALDETEQFLHVVNTRVVANDPLCPLGTGNLLHTLRVTAAGVVKASTTTLEAPRGTRAQGVVTVTVRLGANDDDDDDDDDDTD